MTDGMALDMARARAREAIELLDGAAAIRAVDRGQFSAYLKRGRRKLREADRELEAIQPLRKPSP